MQRTGTDVRPGLDVRRLSRLIAVAVERCALDLSGISVLTEAATGPYVVTSVLAATAGARVVALTRASPYGSLADVRSQTLCLAAHCGVADRITVTDKRSPSLFGEADVITNSGHVRPIVGAEAAAIRSDAVLSLMFETWEIHAGRLDLDINGLRARGVRIAGTNERHPHVDVFSFLGQMAVVQLADAGISTYGGVLAVLSDNPFAAYLDHGLTAAGAHVILARSWSDLLSGVGDAVPDAVLVALTPTGRPAVPDAALDEVSARWPGTPVVQYWGDIDRETCTRMGVRTWPIEAPATGHMGVLPSRLGPEPIVRLQAGGLKVAQILLMPPDARSASDLEYLDAY